MGVHIFETGSLGRIGTDLPNRDGKVVLLLDDEDEDDFSNAGRPRAKHVKFQNCRRPGGQLHAAI
jgi:hypothetical protein